MTDNTRRRMPLIEIPEGIMPKGNKSETYRSLIGVALKEKLPPVMVDSSALPTSVLFIHAALQAKIDAVAEEFKISTQASFSGLCAAAVQYLEARLKARIKDEKAIKKEWAAAGPGILQARSSAQQKFYEKIRIGLALKKITLAEASTGIGKGRAMMAAAVEEALAGKTPVVVAAPTLNVLGQLHDELTQVRKTSQEAQGVTVAIMPGRTEFIDSAKLKAFLDEPASDGTITTADFKAIRKWVGKGAASTGPAKNALAIAFYELEMSPAWLADDLRAITNDFPVNEFLLTGESDPNCESAALLAEYKASVATDAQIVLCTHAMLAIGQKNQWNPAILSQPAVLIVDEAHQLEQAVAQFNSKVLSLFSLRWGLTRFMRANGMQSGSVAGKTVKQLKNLTWDCQQVEDKGFEIPLLNPRTEQEAESYTKILGQLAELQKMLKSRVLNEMDNVGDFRKALAAANLVVTKGGNERQIHLVFSPTKRFPSLQVGAAYMGPELGHLWKSAEGGAVLASATLFIPDQDGALRSDYIRYVLALPLSRIYEIPPIEAGYIYTLPTLHYPSPAKREALSPPRFSKKATREERAEGEAAWLAAAAKEIFAGPAMLAQGGTLILCTSYSQVGGLTSLLLEAGVTQERLIPQEYGKKLDRTKNEFIAAHRQNIRPILIALGPAWTGFNLLDEDHKDDPEKDLLLTDLVILRAPIGLNRSTTMLTRIERRGAEPIVKEALLLFKQGLGRLMRRDKVKHRHLWIMDGRLWCKWEGMDHFTGAARSLLGKYKKQETF